MEESCRIMAIFCIEFCNPYYLKNVLATTHNTPCDGHTQIAEPAADKHKVIVRLFHSFELQALQ